MGNLNLESLTLIGFYLWTATRKGDVLQMWIEQRNSNQSNNIGRSFETFSRVSRCYGIFQDFKGKKFTQKKGRKKILLPPS